MNFLQDVFHKQELCERLVRNDWVGVSCKILAKILQHCKKNAYLARNLQKMPILPETCKKNAYLARNLQEKCLSCQKLAKNAYLARNKFLAV